MFPMPTIQSAEEIAAKREELLAQNAAGLEIPEKREPPVIPEPQIERAVTDSITTVQLTEEEFLHIELLATKRENVELKHRAAMQAHQAMAARLDQEQDTLLQRIADRTGRSRINSLKLLDRATRMCNVGD